MKRALTFLKRLLVCTAGTATIEGVIVLPVAISLMAGGVEFGRIFSTYDTADKSMRDAARYLARVPEDHICDWGLTNAKNLAVYGNIAGTGDPLIPGWTTATVSLQSPICGAAFSDPVVIDLRAAVPYSLFMLTAIGLSNSITFNVKHEERSIGE
jgi:Flp pilus assembly protein TadG